VIALDTTVLMYAVGTEHTLRAPCRQIVQAIADGDLAGTTTVEVLQEFAHVYARRRDRASAGALAVAYATLLAPLLRPEREDLARGMALFESSSVLGAFDAVFAATVIGAPHVTALVSADRAFAAIPELAHINPSDADALATLGLSR
jgi:predicted nucleic acid-binding protein